jgi:hypothetical protein
MASPHPRRRRPALPSPHSCRRTLAARSQHRGHLSRRRGGNRVGRVVPLARIARDRATARTTTRAVALPGKPLIDCRPDGCRDAHSARPHERRANTGTMASLPGCRRATTRRRLRRPALPLSGTPGRALSLRVARDHEGCGTETRADPAPTTHHRAANATKRTANLTCHAQVPRKRWTGVEPATSSLGSLRSTN